MTGSEIILYHAADGEPTIQVRLENETVWLNQSQMAELFQVDRSVVAKHIGNVLESGELDKNSTCAKFAQVQNEGNRTVKREVEYYNLDMIISVGYRVGSSRGIQFRIWATQRLKEYLVKGFTMNDEKLSGGRTDYFDELVERVRSIRASEKNFYQKVRDIFSTSVDYDSRDETAKTFYATVQNKFHYAIHGHTAAELITDRVDASKPSMGLTNWKGAIITAADAQVAKNYLEEMELKRLELLVEQFLSFAELRSVERKEMYMKDWNKKLDEFLVLNEKEILQGAGKVSKKDMESKVREELRKYNRSLPSGDH
jgi:hypothetical protein